MKKVTNMEPTKKRKPHYVKKKKSQKEKARIPCFLADQAHFLSD